MPSSASSPSFVSILTAGNKQIAAIEKARLERIENAPDKGPHAMIRLLARVFGLGIETADMLVNEVMTRRLRDRRAVARYAGITGSPDESGARRREKGLAKTGNARVRRGMIQLAWRWLTFQKERVDRPTGRRGLWVGAGTLIHTARSRSGLRQSIHPAYLGDGHPRSTDSSAIAVAKCLCGTADRIASAGVH